MATQPGVDVAVGHAGIEIPEIPCDLARQQMVLQVELRKIVVGGLRQSVAELQLRALAEREFVVEVGVEHRGLVLGTGVGIELVHGHVAVRLEAGADLQAERGWLLARLLPGLALGLLLGLLQHHGLRQSELAAQQGGDNEGKRLP